MSTKKEKRDPLAKENFLSGNRQKWGGLFLLSAILIMAVQVFSGIDPVPYLQFLTVLTGVLLAGLTGSDVMKAYKVTSLRETHREEIDIQIDKNEHLIKDFEEQYVDDLSYRPIKPEEYQGETWR